MQLTYCTVNRYDKLGEAGAWRMPIGPSCVFYLEIVCDHNNYEVAVTCRCTEPRAAPLFVRHLRLSEIIGDHQPIG
jgi:hypothetical protein